MLRLLTERERERNTESGICCKLIERIRFDEREDFGNFKLFSQLDINSST